MDLQPLPNSGDVSAAEFRKLFAARLGAERTDRAVRILTTLGSMHSFSVANVIHLGLQKGNIDEVIDALEKWSALFVQAPDPITAHVDTRQCFDIMYQQFFMTPEDTIDGFGFLETGLSPNGRYRTYSLTNGPSRLWTPPQR